MTELTLIANVQSSTDPRLTYPVRTDGVGLTCPCPGWTAQMHHNLCAATRGGKCNCKGMDKAVRTTRTCRHTRFIQGEIDRVGGLRAALTLLRSGVSLDPAVAADSEALQLARRRDEETRRRAERQIRDRGPDRVLTGPEGTGARPDFAVDAQGRRLEWAFALVRRDGWSMGVPAQFTQAGLDLWATEWVGMVRNEALKVVVPFDRRVAQQWGQPQVRRMPGGHVARRPIATTPPPPPPVAPKPEATAAPDWLGGRRAIILRE